MMIECKAEHVVLSEKTLMQILSYNLHIPVRYLVITNGTTCYVADKKAEEPIWLSAFPNYE
jgi:predicted type IV restriction endonuclease